MTDRRRWVEWVRFEVVRRLRWTPFRVVAVLYAVFVAFAYRQTPADYVGEASAVLLCWTLYAGFGVDRELGFDVLIANLEPPTEYVAGKLAALAIALAVTSALVAATVFAASGGSGAEAAWHAAAYGLFGLYLLPFALWLEIGLDTRLSGLVALCAFVVLYATVTWIVGPDRLAAWSGIGWTPTRLDTLAPLAARALLVAPIPAFAAAATVAWRLRVRTGRGP